MDLLKKALTSAPTLAFADFSPSSAKFILDADFSVKHGTIGAVLSQVQPPGSGCERPILFKAKSLRPSQRKYAPYKGNGLDLQTYNPSSSKFSGELFSAVYFIQKLRYFLQLRSFILRVDCQSLQWLHSQNQYPAGMILRWLQVGDVATKSPDRAGARPQGSPNTDLSK